MAYLLNLIQEECAASFARQEAINSRLYLLTRELAAWKGEEGLGDHGSYNCGRKDKSVASDSGSVGGSTVPKVTKLGFHALRDKNAL